MWKFENLEEKKKYVLFDSFVELRSHVVARLDIRWRIGVYTVQMLSDLHSH